MGLQGLAGYVLNTEGPLQRVAGLGFIRYHLVPNLCPLCCAPCSVPRPAVPPAADRFRRTCGFLLSPLWQSTCTFMHSHNGHSTPFYPGRFFAPLAPNLGSLQTLTEPW